jgi:hypothetical protein
VWAGMYHIYEEHIMTGNQVYMIVRIFAKVYHFFFLNGWEKICSRNRKKLVSVFFFSFFFFLNSENFFR